jgi:hypothetical protein
MRGRGLHLFGMPDRHDASIRPAHAKVPATLPAHQQQPRVTVVDDVVHQHAERLRDAQTRHPLQPQRQLMHRVEMRCDPSALGKRKRTRLAGRRFRAGIRRVRERAPPDLASGQSPATLPVARANSRTPRNVHSASAITDCDRPTGCNPSSPSLNSRPDSERGLPARRNSDACTMKYLTSPITSVWGANHGWT